MKYLVEMNQTDSGYEIKYKENDVITTSTFNTIEDAMLFMNELDLTGI